MAKKKRPDRPRRPRRDIQPLDLDYIEVPEGEEDKPEPEKIKAKLFTYKGVDYFIEEPEPTLMLELMEAAAERGDLAAMGFMLKQAIGTENYRVLKSIPNLTTKELNQVIELAMDFVMGRMNDTMGNS